MKLLLFLLTRLLLGKWGAREGVEGNEREEDRSGPSILKILRILSIMFYLLLIEITSSGDNNEKSE